MIWLSAVSSDIQFETQELARKLTQANEYDEQRATHLLIYLQGTRNKVLRIQPTQGDNTNLTIDTYCDSDWAGQTNTRKSTTGIAITLQ